MMETEKMVDHSRMCIGHVSSSWPSLSHKTYVVFLIHCLFLFMPKALKRLRGHIAFSLFICPFVHYSICCILRSVQDILESI